MLLLSKYARVMSDNIAYIKTETFTAELKVTAVLKAQL